MAVRITEASMLLVVIVISICIGSGSGRADALTTLSKDHYKKTCPSAETVIRDTIRNATQFDPKIPARILRMHFHDCFIRVFALYFHIRPLIREHFVEQGRREMNEVQSFFLNLKQLSNPYKDAGLIGHG